MIDLILPPFQPDLTNPSSVFVYDRIELGSKIFGLRLVYLSRLDRWFCDLLDEDGVELATGRRVVCDVPLFARAKIARPEAFPAGGTIQALSLDGDSSPPGLEDLGHRVRLFFVVDEASPDPLVSIESIVDPGAS